MIQHNGGHRQATDRLRVQLGHRLAAVDQVVHMHGTAQMRYEHATQAAFTGTEVGRGFWPGNAKAQLAAIRRGNIGSHDVVGVVHGAIGLEVSRAGPLFLTHQVVDSEHPVHWRVIEWRERLWIGPVTHLAFAVNVTHYDHQAQVRLLGDAQDQDDIVGLVQIAHMAQGLGHQPGLQRAVVKLADKAVILGQVQAHVCQGLNTQAAIIHRPLLTGHRLGPARCYCYVVPD